MVKLLREVVCVRNFRKRDYIIAFVVLFLILVINIYPVDILSAIFKSFISSIIGALIIGTITNFLFRNRVI